MPLNTNTEPKYIKIISIFASTIAIASLVIMSGFIIVSVLNPPQKSAQAAGTNNGNLIIGLKDTATTVELSVCIQSTSTSTLHIGNVSNWFSYNSAAVTPNATILEKGQYGVLPNSLGYGKLKWEPVIGAIDTYLLGLTYNKENGDGAIMSSTPELFGKVQFDKVLGSTASANIALVQDSNLYYSTEFASTATPIIQTVSTVVGDCRGSTTVVTASSSSSSTTTVGVGVIGTPVATTTNPVVGLVGGLPAVIALTGNTYPNGTVATVTLPGTTTPITGTIVNGSFVPNSGQTIPAGVTTGAGTAVLTIGTSTVNIPVNISTPPASINIGTPTNTTTNPLVGGTESTPPLIPIIGGNIPNGTPATFTPAGTTTTIYGTIVNGNFVPNPGQILPAGITTGPAVGVISIGLITVIVPTNFTPKANTSGGGGTIIICSGPCPVAQSNTTSTSTPNNSATSNPSPQAASPTTTPVSKGTFKSKIRITDPYVCGEGAYGNVSEAKQNGVDFVYYEFYRDNATTTSYNFKLKMNDKGDFYLPISKTTNKIEDGNYKVVFYAIDNEGNKAQGEYNAQIASNCANAKVNGTNTNTATIRSGGLEILQFIILMLAIVATFKLYQLSKNKEIKLKV